MTVHLLEKSHKVKNPKFFPVPCLLSRHAVLGGWFWSWTELNLNVHCSALAM